MSRLINCKVCGSPVSTGARQCPSCGEPNFIGEISKWEKATVTDITKNTPYRGFMVETESGHQFEFKFYEKSRYKDYFEEVCTWKANRGFTHYKPGPHLNVKIKRKDGDNSWYLDDYEVVPTYRDFFDSL